MNMNSDIEQLINNGYANAKVMYYENGLGMSLANLCVL